MIEDMTKMLAKYMAINQTTEIKTLNMFINYERNNISQLKNSINIQSGEINIPPICDLISNSADSSCENRVLMQKVKKFFNLTLKNFSNLFYE